MAKIDIEFYSYIPRLRINMTWTTDIIPLKGDLIVIPNKFISEWDKKYFSEHQRGYSRDFKVKERKFILDKSQYYYDVSDIKITLDWTDEEKENIDEYLKKREGKNKRKT